MWNDLLICQSLALNRPKSYRRNLQQRLLQIQLWLSLNIFEVHRIPIQVIQDNTTLCNGTFEKAEEKVFIGDAKIELHLINFDMGFHSNAYLECSRYHVYTCKNYLVELASQCRTLASGFIKLVSIHHEENLTS